MHARVTVIRLSPGLAYRLDAALRDRVARLADIVRAVVAVRHVPSWRAPGRSVRVERVRYRVTPPH